MIAAVKVTIREKQGSGMLLDTYEESDVKQAKQDLKNQIDRIQLYQQLNGQLNNLMELIGTEPTPPPPDDPRMVEVQSIHRNINQMRWETRIKESNEQKKLENTLEKRQEKHDTELAKVAQVQKELEKLGVPKELCNEVDRQLEQTINNPGVQMKAILRIVTDGMKGDQEAVREELINNIKRLKQATSSKEIEAKIESMKILIDKWNKSAALETGPKMDFPQKEARNAIERICMGNPEAMQPIYKAKGDSTITYENLVVEILTEMERTANLMEQGSDAKKDSAAEYKKGVDEAVVAMAAVTKQSQGQATSQQRGTGQQVCIAYNNNGFCNRQNCNFEHRQTGQMMEWPTARRNQAQGEDRGRDRSRDRGHRDRSRTPPPREHSNRGSSSRSSSSSSRSNVGSRSQGGGYGDQSRQESSRSRTPDSVGSGATPPPSGQEGKKKRPDTPVAGARQRKEF